MSCATNLQTITEQRTGNGGADADKRHELIYWLIFSAFTHVYPNERDFLTNRELRAQRWLLVVSGTRTGKPSDLRSQYLNH